MIVDVLERLWWCIILLSVCVLYTGWQYSSGLGTCKRSHEASRNAEVNCVYVCSSLYWLHWNSCLGVHKYMHSCFSSDVRMMTVVCMLVWMNDNKVHLGVHSHASLNLTLTLTLTFTLTLTNTWRSQFMAPAFWYSCCNDLTLYVWLYMQRSKPLGLADTWM